MDIMKITINGKEKSFSTPLKIDELLEALELDGDRVAVEHNLNIVTKEFFAETPVLDGDSIEIVQFVGGG